MQAPGLGRSPREWLLCTRFFERKGFIHCSRPEQVVSVANEFYSKQSGLVLLWIDPGKVNAEIRWEAAVGLPLAENQPPADVFPHIYGALNPDAVISVSGFSPDDDGVFRSLSEH